MTTTQPLHPECATYVPPNDTPTSHLDTGTPPNDKTTPHPPETTPHPRPRRKTYAKALGYLIDPRVVVPAEMEKGRGVPGNFQETLRDYLRRIAEHCGIYYDEILPVRHPDPEMPAALCVPVATNFSKKSRVVRTDVLEKAKEFLGTDEPPKWHFIVKV